MSNQLTDVEAFIPEEGKVPLFLLRPFSAALEKCLQVTELTDLFQLVDLNQDVKSAALLREFGGIAVACSMVAEDLANQLALLKTVAPFVQSGTAKSLAITALRDSSAHDQLAQAGASEVVLEPIPPRTLEHKFRSIAQALQERAQTAQMLEQEALKKRERLRAMTQPPQRSSAAVEFEVRWTDAMELQSDCWLSPETLDVKILQGQWILHLLGPSVQTGRWKEFPEKKSDRGECWGWIPNDPERDPFIKDAGHWFYRGKKPELTEQYWTFVGVQPQLWFEFEGETFGVKFEAEAQSLIRIAKNSAHALALREAIGDSFDLSVKRRGSAAVSKDSPSGPLPNVDLFTLMVGCGDLMQDADFLSLDEGSREKRIVEYLSSALELPDLAWDRAVGAFRVFDEQVAESHGAIFRGLAPLIANMVHA